MCPFLTVISSVIRSHDEPDVGVGGTATRSGSCLPSRLLKWKGDVAGTRAGTRRGANRGCATDSGAECDVIKVILQEQCQQMRFFRACGEEAVGSTFRRCLPHSLPHTRGWILSAKRWNLERSPNCLLSLLIMCAAVSEAAASDILVGAQPRIMCWACARSSSSELVDTTTARRRQREEDATRVPIEAEEHPASP